VTRFGRSYGINRQISVYADMPADGLTKTLPKQKHAAFVEQLHLVDVSSRTEGNGGKEEEDNGIERYAYLGVF
jgi:hypothetical protein